jgi:hypothetical protein
MNRRTFLYGSIVAGTGLGITGIYLWNKDLKWKSHPFYYPYILSSICDDDTLRKIGSAYRRMVPVEDSKEKLLNLVNGKLNLKDGSKDNSVLIKELELNVEQDFKEEKIVKITGWILSITEARQCALLSLS